MLIYYCNLRCKISFSYKFLFLHLSHTFLVHFSDFLNTFKTVMVLKYFKQWFTVKNNVFETIVANVDYTQPQTRLSCAYPKSLWGINEH